MVRLMIRSVKSFLSKRGDVFKSVMTFINSASSQKEPSTLKTTTTSEHSQKARNTGSLFRVTRTDFTTPCMLRGPRPVRRTLTGRISDWMCPTVTRMTVNLLDSTSPFS